MYIYNPFWVENLWNWIFFEKIKKSNWMWQLTQNKFVQNFYSAQNWTGFHALFQIFIRNRKCCMENWKCLENIEILLFKICYRMKLYSCTYGRKLFPQIWNLRNSCSRFKSHCHPSRLSSCNSGLHLSSHHSKRNPRSRWSPRYCTTMKLSLFLELLMPAHLCRNLA